MKKSALTITLNDDLLRWINKLANETGADHEHIVNQILTEYFSTQINEDNTRLMFDYLNKALAGDGVFRVSSRKTDGLIYMKSSYRYEHRPELKYTLDINSSGRRLGTIRVAFRANDIDSLARFNNFVQLWIDLERHYAHPRFMPGDIEYTYDNGSFSRTIATPKGGDALSGEILSKAVTEYLRRFDKMLKLYLTHAGFDSGELEKGYREYIRLGIFF